MYAVRCVVLMPVYVFRDAIAKVVNVWHNVVYVNRLCEAMNVNREHTNSKDDESLNWWTIVERSFRFNAVFTSLILCVFGIVVVTFVSLLGDRSVFLSFFIRFFQYCDYFMLVSTANINLLHRFQRKAMYTFFELLCMFNKYRCFSVCQCIGHFLLILLSNVCIWVSSLGNGSKTAC